MRIAFVGKGGSGKTTLSALFSQYIKDKAPVLVIDADLNMHLPTLLGFQEMSQEIHISHPNAVKTIKNYLRGTNERIKELIHFRKTTPPANGSQFIVLHNPNDTILKQFAVGDPNFRLMVVGTYDTDDIGASCYHNNLAILENVISHLVDTKGNLVTDMVAGVDAFANTLHAQFDMLVLAVEPTKRGVEVYKQYQKLADDAGVGDLLFVVGNKVRNTTDKEFISKHIPSNRLLGFLADSKYLRAKDQEGGQLDIAMLEPENKKTIEVIADKLFGIYPDHTARLQRLYDLHRRYVAQDFICERFGDLTGHIDESFNIKNAVKEHD
jgi:CO dehydrogenase maturation factor